MGFLTNLNFMSIHPTAIVHPNSEIHPTAEIGPFCIVEEGVVIGENTKLYSHVLVHSGTVIGKNNQVFHGTVLGGLPQDISFDPKRKTQLVIGDDNIFREGVYIHRSTKEEQPTTIGNGNYFMGNSHAGHDCKIGNKVIIVQNSVLGGHVFVEDYAFISGQVAIHQFCRIGRNSIIGGCSKIIKDVPPYSTVDGNPAEVYGINSVGLKRAGFSVETRNAIKKTYKIIYQSGLNTKQALENLKKEQNQLPEVQHIIQFFETSKRGVIDYVKVGNGKDESKEND